MIYDIISFSGMLLGVEPFINLCACSLKNCRGASVSHSFVLKSDVKGVFQGSPAVVKFRVPTKAALQVSFLLNS
jgi:Translocon-associated protein beta (TRAPB)